MSTKSTTKQENNMKTTTIQYFANIMTTGYKNKLIKLDVQTEQAAISETIKIADSTHDCIGYSTAIKIPGKKIQYI